MIHVYILSSSFCLFDCSVRLANERDPKQFQSHTVYSHDSTSYVWVYETKTACLLRGRNDIQFILGFCLLIESSMTEPNRNSFNIAYVMLRER